MDLYLFFRLVLCFLHGKMKSFELDLGSKLKNQHESSPDLPDREGGGGLLFTSKNQHKYGFTKAGFSNAMLSRVRRGFWKSVIA